MYRITCNLGTNQTCWTWSEALAWLAACGPVAQITNRITRRVVATRTKGTV